MRLALDGKWAPIIHHLSAPAVKRLVWKFKARFKVSGLWTGSDSVTCSLGDTEQNTDIFLGYFADWLQSRTSGAWKAHFELWFGNAVLFWQFCCYWDIAYGMQKCRKFKAPQPYRQEVGPSVHGKYLNLNCIQYMENNYGVSSSPRQVNLLTAFQRVVFTQDRSNTSQKSNSLRGNLRFGEMKINPRYLTFFVRISFLETNSQQHTADLAQLPATCAACSFFAASFHATVQLAG